MALSRPMATFTSGLSDDDPAEDEDGPVKVKGDAEDDVGDDAEGDSEGDAEDDADDVAEGDAEGDAEEDGGSRVP